MAVIEGVNDTLLYVVMGLLLFAVACFLYAWYAMHREERRYHSYEPLEPEDED
jgi:hypothetical protein